MKKLPREPNKALEILAEMAQLESRWRREAQAFQEKVDHAARNGSLDAGLYSSQSAAAFLRSCASELELILDKYEHEIPKIP